MSDSTEEESNKQQNFVRYFCNGYCNSYIATLDSKCTYVLSIAAPGQYDILAYTIIVNM